ncbi:LAFA_0F15456g1_1 [Lachancea sp. 'fantastica']|nr:LAFA_0F15456g1_1 [Lachancea sp. 'fantastica']
MPQQPLDSNQQPYGYQGPVKNKPTNYGPLSNGSINGNDIMMAPHMINSYGHPNMGQQATHTGQTPLNGSEINMTSITQLPQQQIAGQVGQNSRSRKHIQPSPQHPQHLNQNQQTHQPIPQGQAQAPILPLHDFSNSASAVASPFATSAPTPTGSASVPAVAMHGAPAPGLAPRQVSNGFGGPAPSAVPVPMTESHTNLHAIPTGSVPITASGTTPGALPASPYRQNSTSNTGYTMPTAPQSQVRPYVPVSTMPYPIRKYLSNMAILRLHEIINLINVSTGRVDDFDYWKRFTSDLFTPYGILRYSTKGGEETRQFEFTTPIIPLICQSLGSVGVVRLEIVPQQLRAQVLSNGTIFFDCPRYTATYYYPDGSYMNNFSQVKGIFDSNLKMIWVEISSYSFVPGIEWSSLERLISSEPLCHQIFKDLGQSHETPRAQDQESDQQSPSGQKEPQVPTNFAAITNLRSQFGVFHNISSFGVQESFMRALQVNDVISYLKNLKVYQKVHKLRSPLGSLEALVTSSNAEKSNSVPAGASSIYQPNGLSPAPASTMRARTSQPARPAVKKRRQSDLSPLSANDKDSTPKQDNSNLVSDSAKKVKY